jgi:glycerophosphoryl diester phosphodiesterase
MLALVATCLAGACVSESVGPTPDPVFARHRAVSHALGGIDGVTYSNSREALERSLEAGFHLIEVDVTLAGTDLVCFHQGHEDELGVDAAGRTVFAGRFAVLTAPELFEIVERNPHVYLVLDTKQDFATILARAVELAKRIDPRILDRLIPQLYFPSDLELAEEVHAFPRYVFTLYKVPEMTEDGIVTFVQENGIGAVTMPPERLSAGFARRLRDVGALVYVHTLNEPDEIRRALDRGAHGIYTDFDLSLVEPAVRGRP